MPDAEDTFIRVTREAQSSDLGNTMATIQKESGEFQAEVRQKMSTRMQAIIDEQNAASVTNRIQKLEDELKDLKSKLSTSTNQSGASTK